MAKIVGPVPPFIGTRDNVTIYLMNGEYIARSKSSLTGKRVKKDPAFARTMEWAGRLKQGARIASSIYRQMPVDDRVYKRYREITGKAMSLLKEGFSVGDVITMLEAVYLPQLMGNTDSVIVGIKPAAEPESELSEGRICNSTGRKSHYYVGNSKCSVYNGANNNVYLVCSACTVACNRAYNSVCPVNPVYPVVRNTVIYNAISVSHLIGEAKKQNE
ncbi:hypothetical protein [Chitinophaga filiformis]|uniref:Uncharacterized protein n=1 Tax=Chitinophaga filiformis TaxID=104663 RepID=A0A1G7WP57_CHIFI|nr:hypothetical protein [Chitinophaga filiformis]SDG73000.1 hypothetical protein SAMN04488121_10661 [Chitinophaga filiformis]